MSDDLGKQIEELNAEIDTYEAGIVEEAFDLVKSLRSLADKIENMANSGGGSGYIESLFSTPSFVRDHVDWVHSRLSVSIYKLHEQMNQRADAVSNLEDLVDQQAEQDEEAAANAIHAGLKNED